VSTKTKQQYQLVSTKAAPATGSNKSDNSKHKAAMTTGSDKNSNSNWQ